MSSTRKIFHFYTKKRVLNLNPFQANLHLVAQRRGAADSLQDQFTEREALLPAGYQNPISDGFAAFRAANHLQVQAPLALASSALRHRTIFIHNRRVLVILQCSSKEGEKRVVSSRDFTLHTKNGSSIRRCNLVEQNQPCDDVHSSRGHLVLHLMKLYVQFSCVPFFLFKIILCFFL